MNNLLIKIKAIPLTTGGYNLHQFSDAIGLVSICYSPILGSAVT